MGLRFFRRLRIAPGLTLNLTKRGASVSAGVPGAHVTAGTSGTRATVGLPGTGLFYTQQLCTRYSDCGKPAGHTGPCNSGMAHTALPPVTLYRSFNDPPAPPRPPGHAGCAWVVFAGLCCVWLVVWLLPRLVH